MSSARPTLTVADQCKGYLCSIRAQPNMQTPAPHPCPYQLVVNADQPGFTCNCCEACQQNCQEDLYGP